MLLAKSPCSTSMLPTTEMPVPLPTETWKRVLIIAINSYSNLRESASFLSTVALVSRNLAVVVRSLRYSSITLLGHQSYKKYAENMQHEAHCDLIRRSCRRITISNLFLNRHLKLFAQDDHCQWTEKDQIELTKRILTTAENVAVVRVNIPSVAFPWNTMIACNARIQRLQLSGFPGAIDVKDNIKKLLDYVSSHEHPLPRLCSMDFEFLRLHEETWKAIGTCFGKQIRKLVLENCFVISSLEEEDQYSRTAMEVLTPYLENLTALELAFDLPQMVSTSSDYIMDMFDCFVSAKNRRWCHQLQELQFRGVDAVPLSFWRTLSLQCGHSIRTIKLNRRSYIENVRTTHFLEILPGFRNLTTLTLTNVTYHASWNSDLALKIIKKCPSIRRLEICDAVSGRFIGALDGSWWKDRLNLEFNTATLIIETEIRQNTFIWRRWR